MSRYITPAVSLFLASLALGWTFAPLNPGVDVVSAACGVGVNCGADATLTSALQVTHNTTDPSPIPVEPDSGETWNINAQ